MARRPARTCRVVERQAVVDDVVGAHAKGKIPEGSNSVITLDRREKLVKERQTAAVQSPPELYKLCAIYK